MAPSHAAKYCKEVIINFQTLFQFSMFISHSIREQHCLALIKGLYSFGNLSPKTCFLSHFKKLAAYFGIQSYNKTWCNHRNFTRMGDFCQALLGSNQWPDMLYNYCIPKTFVTIHTKCQFQRCKSRVLILGG